MSIQPSGAYPKFELSPHRRKEKSSHLEELAKLPTIIEEDEESTPSNEFQTGPLVKSPAIENLGLLLKKV